MAKLKINWKAGGSSMSLRGLTFNDDLVASTSQADAAGIAKAHGKKNIAPFQIKTTRALIGDFIEVEPKGSNIIAITEKRSKNGQYKPVRKSFTKFQANADVNEIKVTVKKRGLIMGLISGKYKIKVNAK